MPLLLLYRQKLKSRLTENEFRLSKSIEIITFPTKLREFVLMSSGGPTIEKIFLLIGKQPNAFNFHLETDNLLYIDWQDLTHNRIKSSEYFQDLFKYFHKECLIDNMVKINLNTNDISKKNVAKCFASTFGYALDIDPTTYSGEIVVKSDENAKHDGEVITEPIRQADIDPSKVYSIAINNIDSNGFATDFRLPYIGKCLNFCYVKKRPKSDRFSNTNSSAIKVNSSEIFSESEFNSIDNFCRMLKLDFGELDCLRDNNTGKLYIVDVAKTPSGPPNGISNQHKYDAILEMSVAFVKNFLNTLHS